MSEGVVDILEPVQIHHQKGHRAAGPTSRADGPAEFVQELRPVGQARQTIVGGQHLKLVTRDLPGRDVQRHTLNSHNHPVRITDGFPSHLHPPVATVGANHLQFDVKGIPRRLRSRHIGAHVLPTRGGEQLAELGELGHRSRRVKAQHEEELLGPGHVIRGAVKRPTADVGDALGAFELRPNRLVGGLPLLARGDVQRRAVQLDDGPVQTPDRLTTRLYPAVRAITAHRLQVHRVADTRRLCLCDGSRDALPALRHEQSMLFGEFRYRSGRVQPEHGKKLWRPGDAVCLHVEGPPAQVGNVLSLVQGLKQVVLRADVQDLHNPVP